LIHFYKRFAGISASWERSESKRKSGQIGCLPKEVLSFGEGQLSR